MNGSQTPVQNSVSSLCHKGNHFQVPDIMIKDSCQMRIDEAVVTQQKRRRVEVLNTVCMNDLLEMLKKSDEMAVEVLEKFLISYLGIPYQIVDKTVGHDILPNVLEHSLPETRNLAFQIANAFQVGNLDEENCCNSSGMKMEENAVQPNLYTQTRLSGEINCENHCSEIDSLIANEVLHCNIEQSKQSIAKFEDEKQRIFSESGLEKV